MIYNELLSKLKNENFINSFEVIEGKGSVIVSAPHSVTQTRDGKIKYAEPETGVLAVLLHDKTGCHVIYKTKNNKDDANYDENSDYKNFLIDYIKKRKEIKFLLDLHQMSPTRENLFCIGTGYGKNLCNNFNIVDNIVNKLNHYGFDNITIDKPFAASYKNTVSSMISRECEIPCIQLEINCKLVCESFKDYCFEKVVLALVEIIDKYNSLEM